MRKLVAAGLAAALSLSIAPVASAQLSSLGSLSSSSSSVTPTSPEDKRSENAKALGAAFESNFEATGAVRYEAHDEVAEAALEVARNGGVAWTPLAGGELEGHGAVRSADGHDQGFLRIAHQDVQKALDILSAVTPEDLGTEYPYGLAVDADEDWAYLAFTTPIIL